MTRMTSLAAFCAVAMCGLNAHAASQSSASITDLTFTVMSLDPSSNEAPSFSFVTSKGSTTYSISTNDNAIGESDSASHTRAGTFSFTIDQLSKLTNAGAYSSVSSDTLSVKGYANGPQTSYNASASTGSNNNGYYYYGLPLNLTLSANSVLLIDAKVSLTASASNASACSYYYYCNSSESSSASASSFLSYNYSGDPSVSSSYNSNKTLSLHANATGGTQSQNYEYDPSVGYYRWVYSTQPGTDQSKSLNDTLHSVFSNASSITQSATFGLSVSVTGQASTVALPGDAVSLAIAAIPEPSTYALTLQGLLLGGWLVRRQRRQQG